MEGGRRPVLIVTRSEGAAVLTTVVGAPITSTIRNIPTEIRLDADQGLPRPCVASFDNLRPIWTLSLTERIGTLTFPHTEICRALEALADC